MALHRIIYDGKRACDATITGDEVIAMARGAYIAGLLERGPVSERDARELLQGAGLVEFSRFVHDALTEARP